MRSLVALLAASALSVSVFGLESAEARKSFRIRAVKNVVSKDRSYASRNTTAAANSSENSAASASSSSEVAPSSGAQVSPSASTFDPNTLPMEMTTSRQVQSRVAGTYMTSGEESLPDTGGEPLLVSMLGVGIAMGAFGLRRRAMLRS